MEELATLMSIYRETTGSAEFINNIVSKYTKKFEGNLWNEIAREFK